MEGKKFKLRICLRGLHLCCRFCCELGRHNASVEFTAFGSGPDAKPNRASAFWFFLSTTMVVAPVRTHFPTKNTRVYCDTVSCVTCVTSNRVEVYRLNSQLFGNGADVKHCRASGFRYFLSTAMVFAVVRTHFPRKTPVYMLIELR